ncbi:MAG: hypothetical protein RID53_18295 [Coleofasciculus sp. B1-GNL1-01]|uniref:hypothetical protein n=1 Tax=Coleofasciculus sp. B1-GNL1-01 TaxID=3068484 RepID=UPI0032F1A921
MKTLTKWIAIGTLELIFCFWLLGNAATLVSSPSDQKVWLGVSYYVVGLLVVPGVSVSHVVARLHNAQVRHKQIKEAFPDCDVSLVELLDVN